MGDFVAEKKLPAGFRNLIMEFVEAHFVGVLVAIAWIFFFWEFYLSMRQRRLMLKLTKPPSVLDNILTPEVYEKSRIYALEKGFFGNVKDIYSNIFMTIFMIYYGYWFSWEQGKNLVELCGLDPNNEIYVTGGCITVIRVFSVFICDLPFNVYETFVLEQKFNFNNETPLFFIKDQILKFLVSHIIIVPLTCVMIWIIKNGGDYFFIYLWLFVIAMSLLLMVIYPEFIAPLFDKYTSLPEGELRDRIEALASSVNYPLYKLYVVEGSRRSSHSNAYLYGFYKHKRIVLFDTLIAEFQKKKAEAEKEKAEAEKEKQKAETKESTTDADNVQKETKSEVKEIRGCNTEEIVAVLAHELGHWQRSHAIKMFLLTQIVLLANFVLFACLLDYSPMYKAFGFTDKPILIGLTVVTSHILTPFNNLVSWTMTIISRIHEFEADAYANSLGFTEHLKTSLIKLHKDNLGYPLFDKLYSNWHHSHPPLLERLDALKKDD